MDRRVKLQLRSALAVALLRAGSRRELAQSVRVRPESRGSGSGALFRCHLNFKFFHSLSITLIFSHLYGVLNVGKKITNYTV